MRPYTLTPIPDRARNTPLLSTRAFPLWRVIEIRLCQSAESWARAHRSHSTPISSSSSIHSGRWSSATAMQICLNTGGIAVYLIAITAPGSVTLWSLKWDT